MRIISLFAGIGGFDLGFRRAGHSVVAHVEISRPCQAVLRRHFTDSLLIYDVRDATRHTLPACDVLTAGWPCQDVSIAGRRAGLVHGERSNLFFAFIRIAHEIRPSFIVWENVPGLRTSDNGRDFARVLMAFHRIGYDGGWRTLDAQEFGLAQCRKRIFGVFAKRDIGARRCAEILAIAPGLQGDTAQDARAQQEATRTDRSGVGNSRETIAAARAYTLLAGNGGRTWAADGRDNLVAYRTSGTYAPSCTGDKTACLTTSSDPAAILLANAASVRRLTPVECERLQGFPDGWTSGHSDSSRYRMLGNAVAVPVAQWIAERVNRFS